MSLHRSADNEDIAPFPELLDQGVEGVPAERTHCPEPPVDGRTLWLLLPDPDRRSESHFIILTIENISI